VEPSSSSQKKTVLVTGGSRGLGLETALTLAQNGWRVWAGFRNAGGNQNIEEEARRRGVSIGAIQLDVTDPASINAGVKTVIKESGGLYSLVNNAGLQDARTLKISPIPMSGVFSRRTSSA
jgi:NAD(P)-dependent dehydrogenase (short-subunit alcohol dehydrogenase family)